jgi:hypothetical protein
MLFSCFDFSNCNLPPLGTLDVIGKQRRAAWSQLGQCSDSFSRKFCLNRFLGTVIGSYILPLISDPWHHPLF